jgi:acetyl-CoA carboxylase carboxyltransferase component
MDELIRMSPADGLVAGLGSVNGEMFGEDAARCMVMSYDYTVFAGTQGFMNHKKMDRLFALAGEWRIPLVLFAEGGGGRPGETDYMGVAGLELTTFRQYAKLSGLAPSSRSCPVAALRATPRSSAAATSSSRRETAISAWAGRP